MLTNHFQAIMKITARAIAILTFATVAHGQTINLTAAPNTTTMSDGTVVPMWGYSCGAAAAQTAPAVATCAALNTAAGGAWSPVVITVPVAPAGTATSLTINLTNNLSFTPTGAAAANTIPTSIVIIGQVGGGLGSAPTRTMSPDHSLAQACPSWFIAANPPGTACTAANAVTAVANTPPSQQMRVQSMGAEVTAVAATTVVACPAAPVAPATASVTAGCGALTWTNLKPGTYLLESGTHPSIQVPMGLIGVLVVTTAPTSAATVGTAYPGAAGVAGAIPAVTYNADLPLEFSEIDPVQNGSVSAAVNTAGFLETNVWSGLYGGCGNALNANGSPNSGTTASATPYNTCYPPAVNYTPFYFLINGVAFNKTGASASLFNATAGGATTGISGTVLARLVNAGLRMHVPSIVGTSTTGFNGSGTSATVSGFTLIAEDGNPVPGVQVAGAAAAPAAPRVQTDVFMAAGKVFDVMFNVPATPTGAAAPPAVGIFARDLGLSADSSARDAGMIAYIGVNGAALPIVQGTAGSAFANAHANNDVYNGTLLAGQPFGVTDPSKGVIANDVNVFGVTLLTAPTGGTLSCTAQPQNTVAGICRNGTFTYTPGASWTATSTDTFTYCANTSAATVAATGCPAGLAATVTLGTSTPLAGLPTAITQNYTARSSTYIKMPAPTLLIGNTDPNKLPLSVVPVIPTTPGGVVIDAKGGFSVTVTSGTPSATFQYTVQNSQGRTATGTVNITFPAPSNLQVNVIDSAAYQANACNALSVITPAGLTCGTSTVPVIVPFITDYRWIIEEDKTFWIDPNCTTNSSITTPGCPSTVAAGGTLPAFATNFHASWMDYVAQGCTGPLSCEGGQTMLDTVPGSPTLGQHIPAICDLGSGACRPDPSCTALPCFTAGGTQAVLPSSVVLDPTKRYYISILPGDAGNPFPAYTAAPNCLATPFNPAGTLNTACGHTMSGAQVQPACNIYSNPAGCPATATFAPVLVKTVPTPLPTGKLSVFVFEDDFPLNGEQDGGGGNGTVAPIEPGLGGFEIILWDTYGGLGDFTGQDTHDDFNQPLTNSLAGTIDPATGLDACPISAEVTQSVLGLSAQAALTSGSNTFSLASAAGFNAGTPLSDTGGAIPAGTTVVSVTGSGPYIVTMSANATATVPSTDTITAQGDGTQAGITGRIVTCPKYESDNQTLSPLAGQAVIANLMPDKFSVQAYPGADRIARGEEWLQTNTLDGQHPHDAFIRIGEPSYFQEFGPSGYHVSIGFANPKIINARYNDVCAGAYGSVGPCTNKITGSVDVQRISRTPDQRLYPSGSRDALAWTQCWVSLGDPDAEDFMFEKCDANGNFEFDNVPGGFWRITIGDQWNDQIIDGLSTPADVGCNSNAANSTVNAGTCPGGQTLALGNVGVQQWQANLYTRYFLDTNKTGVWDPATDIGVGSVYTRIKYRNGSNANALLSDPNGVANFNETFPLFNWYVVEPDLGRYKRTGTHTVYDAGGPADGSTYCGNGATARQCGTSTGYNYLANTYEGLPLPADLSVPGAVYCSSADCTAEGTTYFQKGTAHPSSAAASTGRIDPPWVNSEGWSGFVSHGDFIEFGVAPFAACNPAQPVSTSNFCATVPSQVINTTTGTATATTKQVGENGGIHGHTAYAATRPFDDASQMIEQPWAPLVPNITLNLYQEGFAADGVTPTLTLVDTTVSTSWDKWAQGFYPNSTAGSGAQKPYMSCPGQGTATGTNADPFFYTLYDQPEYLDWYASIHSVASGGPVTLHTLPYNSQYKCYDAMHVGDQIQPAPYDGYYSFPSSMGVSATTGKPLTSATAAPGFNQLINASGVAAGTYFGTNCTVCVPNPDTTDPYRVGTPMLPPGKYVVEVVMPPGYEVEKEEDKNLLIGDNFIAPVTVQFPGLGGSVFILPDQASVASLYDPTGGGVGFNPSNYQNETTGLGLNEELSGVPGTPGFQDPVWPCVGEMRVVPDYLSLFPADLETAPFAGATRPLCDRKEVTLTDQASVSAKFYIFTSTHIAAKFTGVITNDFTSEFDPFSPQFGEKFSPPNLPVSTKDYLGNEISRVYSDHWGTYESLNFSSWEVNPPNITGYSPSMMVQCMNDAGPILDTRTTIADPNNPGATIPNPTLGQMITDPMYNSAYSQFCYEEPYMPGLTTYLDTPVVPTQAFIGAAYNNADCAYPDTTPAIAEVDGNGAIGPWVSAAGQTLTITALGNVLADNSGYAGPSAGVVPFSLKKVQRHYGFGATTGTVALLGSDGNTYPLTGVTWNDMVITGTVPAGLPNCLVQQQAQYQTDGPTALGSAQAAQCGQLVITASNGKQSIDTVTVTIGGKPPTHVASAQSIQTAIDAADPGDLIIVDPTCTASTTTAGVTTTTILPTCTSAAPAGAVVTNVVASHNEMLLMWKPVRLQGVGAATSVLNANASPAGRLLDPWRRHINCLFGLTLSGVPRLGLATGMTAPAYDTTSTYNCPETWWNKYSADTQGTPQVDRLPLEAVVGWDAIVNGNLAEQLQEPSLMGAYEGAGITVLGKGVWTSPGESVWTDGTEGGAFPTDALLLQDVAAVPGSLGTPLGPQYSYCTTPGSAGTEMAPNPYPSNFECNPSSIDGISITNSSQGGGGIFVHGWAHNLQIANNRVYNNAGTLSGGMSIGQGEFPVAITVTTTGAAAPAAALGESALDAPPSCEWNAVVGLHLPYCLDLNVNVHHNYITNNAGLGDELFSGTLSGGGGATFCTGADYYKFNYNWVCGNVSAGEGGGVTHLGFIYNGDIEHNTIVLNQSTNPTIPTNGGGISIQGTPDTDPICGALLDADCPPGLSDGTGPNLVINANLIEANSADSGAGGGIRLNQVNGSDLSTFPNGCVTVGAAALNPCASGGVPAYTYWNSVSITNNIINNNLAGWDGGGISLQDSLNVSIVNNTIANNDSLASSGVLTQSIGTPEASAPAGNCVIGTGTASCPQVAGVASTGNSALLTSAFPVAPAAPITCPPGQSATGCRTFSNPIFANNIIWQNRSFQIGISGAGTGNQNQQNLVSLYNANFTRSAVGSAAPVQVATGECSTGVSYWDIGVRGNTGPTNHTGGTLNPVYSVLTSTSGYSGTNATTAPTVVAEYCNGSRVPPECSVADGCGGPGGFGVPPGINDALTPNPLFSLTPNATVDEGNNWINVSWGPLALTNPAVLGAANPGAGGGDYGGGALLANYNLTTNFHTVNSTVAPPTTDFFGNARPASGFNPGAVEFVAGASGGCTVEVSPSTLAFGSQVDGTTSTQNVTIQNLCGATSATGGTYTVAGTGFARVTTGTFPAGAPNCAATGTLAAGASCTIKVGFTPPSAATSTGYSGTLTVAYGAGVTVSGSPVGLTGTGVPAVLTATVSPTSLTFPTALFDGTVSAAQTLTVTNTGTGPLVVGTYTFGGGAAGAPVSFNRPAGAAGGTCGTTLAVGASCTVNVRFAPVAPDSGTVSRTLTVAFTGATVTGSPVSLTGTVSAITSISPTSGVRGTTVPVTVTATNLPPATGMTMSGAGVTCTITGTPTATTVTANCVILATAGLTARNVTVTTASGSSTLTGAFQVTGATLTISAPAPVLDPTPASTTTKTGTVTVTNTATGATAGSYAFNTAPTLGTKTGTGTGTFSLSTPATGTQCTATTVLAAGQSCTIGVTYTPLTSGTNDTATARDTVTIGGTGAAAATQTSASFPAN